MIEISTGICHSYAQALDELGTMRDLMVEASHALNPGICGGGTHPFQQWSERTISDSPRYRYISELYGYLAKQFTVFGQHVHIGCPSADESLYLLHAIGRYVPHFIALAASSPYVQGVDTGFASARLNSVSAFPMSGRAPLRADRDAFTAYFNKMHATGVIESMKDFYWDIRPKPEFGTIEVRVMDTPLTVRQACDIAAYIRALARYLLLARPFMPQEDDYRSTPSTVSGPAASARGRVCASQRADAGADRRSHPVDLRCAGAACRGARLARGPGQYPRAGGKPQRRPALAAPDLCGIAQPARHGAAELRQLGLLSFLGCCVPDACRAGPRARSRRGDRAGPAGRRTLTVGANSPRASVAASAGPFQAAREVAPAGGASRLSAAAAPR